MARGASADPAMAVEPVALPRARLVEQVLGRSEAVLVEAGGGYGKTVLVDQVTRTAGTGVLVPLPRRDIVDVEHLKALLLDAAQPDPVSNRPRVAYSGPVDLDDLVDRRGGSAVLLVDNAPSLTDDAAEWLAEFARDSLPHLRLVASGRVMPQPLAALELDGAATRIDSDDLRLSSEESQALISMRLGQDDGERLWSALHHFSEGWVALLLLVIRRLERSADRWAAAADLLRHPALIAQLVDYYATELADPDRELMVQLAHFSMVSETLADALGSRGLLRRLSQAGIPFSQGTDGWWRLSQTVKEHLTTLGPLDAEVAHRAAPLLAAQGAELTAAELLLESGDPDAATMLVAQMPAGRIDTHDPRALIRLMARLGPATESAPRALLHLARVYGNVGLLGEEREAIDRAFAAVQARGTHDDLAVEIEAESLFQRAFVAGPEVVARIEELLETAAKGSRGRARLLDALGVVLSGGPDEHKLRRAENAMRQAAILWTDLGEPSRAATIQRGLAVRVLDALGKHEDAVRLLRNLRGTSETPYGRMLCLVFEARALALGGEADSIDAVIDEARSLGELLGIDWVAGHTAWSGLLAAANDGVASTVRARLAEAESLLGQLAEDAGGVQFLCEAADACASIEAYDDAERLLTAAQDHRSEDPALVAFTEAGIAARRCDVGAADALGGLLESAAITPGLRWKAELLRGYALVTAGDLVGAHRCLDASLERVAGIGQPGLADRREARVLDTLRAAVRHVVDHDVAVGEADTTYEVRLLGGFEIRRDGELIASPIGRAADLVKWVGLAGGRASVEAVVELLWPDEMPGIGLRRLKNVLSRSRAAYGPLIHRDGSHLTLVDCSIDLVRFENAAGQVALGRGAERVTHARHALALYTGPVLPDDVYDDRIDQRREAARRRALSLVDVVLTAVLVTGDLDAAVAVLQMAIDNDPGDQERPLRVARALVYAGRGLEARSLARQAIALATEYGMPPAAEWEELNLVGGPAAAPGLGR